MGTTPSVTASTSTTIQALVGKIRLERRNLIIAGDSNDERFFRYFCRRLTGIFDSILYTDKIVNPVGEYHGRITWPGMARIMTCHDPQRNISAAMIFHQGLYSIPPQPGWYFDFAKRRMHTHYPGSEGRQGIIPVTDQARYIWPQVVLQLLPKRENILLLQSSMWDSFAVLEGITGSRVSQMTEAQQQMTVAAKITAANLTDWGWLDRATQTWSSWQQGFQESGLAVVARLWRTNPNCPRLVSEGSAIAVPLNDLHSEAVKEAVWKEPWLGTCIVDLQKHFDVQSASQCDKHHFTKEGWQAYWEALSECIEMPQTVKKRRSRVRLWHGMRDGSRAVRDRILWVTTNVTLLSLLFQQDLRA